MALKITVIAVGKLKERFWVEACAEYAKRLGAYAKLEFKEIPDRDPAKVGGEEKGVDLECSDVVAAIPERAHVILLDINGKELFLCHGYSIGLGGASILIMKNIKWSNDSWPSL